MQPFNEKFVLYDWTRSICLMEKAWEAIRGKKKSTLRCIMDNLGTCVGRGAWGVRREVKQEKDKSRGKVWLSGAAGRRGKGRGSFF